MPGWPRWICSRWRQLDFTAPDFERFPCLALAYQALRAGGTAPAVLNAANEVAVAAFLDRQIPFLSIPRVIEEVLDTLPVTRSAAWKMCSMRMPKRGVPRDNELKDLIR